MEEIEIFIEQENFVLANPQYKSDVEYFLSFMKEKLDVNCEDINELLSNVRTSDVEDCLKLLCESGTFKRKTKARSFISAVSNFFRYLFTLGLSNKSLQKDLTNISSTYNASTNYHRKLMKYIENTPMLEDECSFLSITDEETEKLIIHCDNLINRRISYTKGSEPMMFGQMASSLAIKLILFSGISYGVVRSIDFNDLKSDNGTIKINGILLRLPPRLLYQFKEYVRIYNEKGTGITTSKLFVGKDGTQWGSRTQNSGMVPILRAAIQKTSISEINRGAIQQHMRNGLPEKIISQLTGEKDEVLSSCFEIVFSDSDYMFSFINSAIVKNPIYSRL